MQLRKALIIEASKQSVFRALFEALKQWRQLPGLGDKNNLQIHVEPKIGGRVFATWTTKTESTAEALLGTIIVINEPEVLRIAGPFSFGNRYIHANISFECESLGPRTQASIICEAIEEIDEEIRKALASAAQNFLDILKSCANQKTPQGEKGHMRVAGSEPSALPGTFASQAMRLIDGIDDEIFGENWQSWKAVVKRIEDFHEKITPLIMKSAIEAVHENESAVKETSSNEPESPNELVEPLSATISDDPEVAIEQRYQQLQSKLIEVRHAVAREMAASKQVKLQIERNEDQAHEWLKRASMATEQNQLELASQAMQRRAQFVEAAESLEIQSKTLELASTSSRQRLADLEGMVQKAYTQKQLLIARQKAAQATITASDIISKFDFEAALSAMTALEGKVVELEANAADKGVSTRFTKNQLNLEVTLYDAITTFEQTIIALKKLQKAMEAGAGSNKE